MPDKTKLLSVCQGFERLAPRLAPIDLTYPVYAVLTSLSPAFAGCFDHLAYFGIRNELAVDRGPGLVLFVSEAMLQRIPSHLAPEVLFWILLHEFGHAICSLASGEFQSWVEMLATVQTPKLSAFAANRMSSMTDPAQSDAGPQLESHGLTFTRVMAHLDYRLRRAGIESEIAAAGERYGQRPYRECLVALGDEPARSVDKPFSEIISRELPPEFASCLVEQC